MVAHENTGCSAAGRQAPHGRCVAARHVRALLQLLLLRLLAPCPSHGLLLPLVLSIAAASHALARPCTTRELRSRTHPPTPHTHCDSCRAPVRLTDDDGVCYRRAGICNRSC
jgi:hypothetical protein